MTRLSQRGRFVTRSERVPYDTRSGRYLVACWLRGRCPECGEGIRGYTCESCGQWFSPQTVREPEPVLGDGPLEWRTIRSTFLAVDLERLFELLGELGVNEHRSLLATHFAREGPYLRLTHPFDWGIPWTADGLPANAVLFTFGAGLPAYAALCGEVYGALSGRGVNAFDPDSGVVTVKGLGFDVMLPNLAGPLAVHAALADLRPYDHLVCNRFLQLEGEKFSTTSGHLVAVSDIAASGHNVSDLVRYHLARICPEEDITDFWVDDFFTSIEDELRGGLERAVGRCLQTGLSPTTPPDPGLIARLERVLARQEAAFTPERLRLSAAASCLDEWARDGGSGASDGDAYWWLKGAALLAYPIMPRWGQMVWTLLGYGSKPSFAHFWRTPELNRDARYVPFSLLTRSAVEASVARAPQLSV